MKRIVHFAGAALLGAWPTLAPGLALADASFPPPMLPDASNAKLPTARGNLGLSAAPKTNLFTLAWTGGLAFGSNLYSGLTPETLLQIMPFESPPYAVRIGFCNPYNSAITINSAGVYPSSTYSLAANVDANQGNVAVVPTDATLTATSSGTTTITVSGVQGYIFTDEASGTGSVIQGTTTRFVSQSTGTIGGAGTYVTSANTSYSSAALTAIAGGENKIYFGNAGANSPQINDGSLSTTRTLTIAANSANTGNVAVPCTIQWSDWTPFQPVARTDGGTQTLGFFYVTIGGTGTITYGMTNKNGVFSEASWNRGRKILCAKPWNNTVDYADNPAGTGFAQNGGGNQYCPIYAVQYLTANPGMQIVLTGDSLSIAPTTDNISSPLWRACKDMSTPANPCEVANLAWGGAASPVWSEFYRQNIAAMPASVVAMQAISRNDGTGIATLQELIGKQASYANLATPGARLIWNQAGGEPSWDGNTAAIAGWNWAYNLMMGLASASPTVPFVNCPLLIGNYPSAPWDYLAGMSDDNTHPNATGAQTCEPQATAALQAVQ